MTFRVGDVVSRIANYSHGGVHPGQTVTVEWISDNGRNLHFVEDTTLTSDGSRYLHSTQNYHLVSSRKEKKLSGFGKFIKNLESRKETQ
jgi:hypothetical protein